MLLGRKLDIFVEVPLNAFCLAKRTSIGLTKSNGTEERRIGALGYQFEFEFEFIPPSKKSILPSSASRVPSVHLFSTLPCRRLFWHVVLNLLAPFWCYPDWVKRAQGSHPPEYINIAYERSILSSPSLAPIYLVRFALF